MERPNRKTRRANQVGRHRVVMEYEQPVEFACCGSCDHLIKVYQGEDGPTKPCPRCGWNRHLMGGSWNWRGLANVR